MLPGDWLNFRFEYTLDLRSLLSHIVAIEEYREAAMTRVLPPNWLGKLNGQPAQSGAPAAGDTNSVPSLSAGSAEGSPAETKSQASSAQPEKRLPIRDTSVARAWVKQRFGPGSAPLALADILTIHKMVADQSGLYGGPAGAFRTIGVRVGRKEVGGFHIGAPPKALPSLMEGFVRFINKPPQCDLPPVIHALVGHFFFDTIHPFLDANGRTSRLLAAAILSQRGYNVDGIYGLIKYFYQHDFRYHTILHKSWRHCPFELTEFVAFGMEGFLLELKSVASFVRMKFNRSVDYESSARVFRRRIGNHSRVI